MAPVQVAAPIDKMKSVAGSRPEVSVSMAMRSVMGEGNVIIFCELKWIVRIGAEPELRPPPPLLRSRRPTGSRPPKPGGIV